MRIGFGHHASPFSAAGFRRAPRRRLERQQQGAVLDLLAQGDAHLGDDAVRGRLHRVLHLHGLEHHQRVARAYRGRPRRRARRSPCRASAPPDRPSPARARGGSKRGDTTSSTSPRGPGHEDRVAAPGDPGAAPSAADLDVDLVGRPGVDARAGPVLEAEAAVALRSGSARPAPSRRGVGRPAAGAGERCASRWGSPAARPRRRGSRPAGRAPPCAPRSSSSEASRSSTARWCDALDEVGRRVAGEEGLRPQGGGQEVAVRGDPAEVQPARGPGPGGPPPRRASGAWAITLASIGSKSRAHHRARLDARVPAHRRRRRPARRRRACRWRAGSRRRGSRRRGAPRSPRPRKPMSACS